jgi:hypothetical protein
MSCYNKVPPGFCQEYEVLKYRKDNAIFRTISNEEENP